MELSTLPVVPASRLYELTSAEMDAPWSLAHLSGRLTEILGRQGDLSLVAALIREAQEKGEPAAWIFTHRDTFYPPDLADNSIDLAALPVVFAGSGEYAFRSAELLLRSGAFGLIIIDRKEEDNVSAAYQGRVVRLAQHYQAAVLCLTAEIDGAQPLGSLVSLRVEPRRVVSEQEDILYEARATKDKRHGPGWTHRAVYRSLAGLR